MTTSMSCSPPTTASCRATSDCCSRVRITSTRSCGCRSSGAPLLRASIAPSVVTRPVGLVDLAPTFCAIAGIDVPPWMQGRALPVDDADADARGFERVLTEWDSELFGVGVHVRTITRDGWVCSAYRKGTVHDGTEGELYGLDDDPVATREPVERPGCSRRPATTCSPTCGTTSRRPTTLACNSKPRC